MTSTLRIHPHPLGVVVSDRPDVRGELLLPGEECCGLSYDELTHIANTTHQVEVTASAAKDYPLRRNSGR